ncbi:MAG: hypothetical protein EXR95_03890 [Gemmatimonadetes bacterium]|nr:hypothetical protein [Gemmatimonadota bacterium]
MGRTVTKRLSWTTIGLLALAAACDRGDGGGTLLARAGGHELGVTEAAGLIAPEAGIPARPEVVLAVADLWIDYTLLATAAAEDSTLENVDLKPLVEQQEEVEMIGQLRDSAVPLDTAIAEEEVRRRFAQEAPGSRVRARHILLTPPDGATQFQRDSVKAAAEALLKRVQAGEKLETLATEYSADPGSAARGGDLGFFERGAMVAAFDSVAFTLEPGQVSSVVATPFGYHIIRVEEKQTPGFDELGPQFRQQLQSERVMKAESTFVAGLEERAKMEVVKGAAGLTREVAKNPLARMGGRALRRPLVKYEGGALTVAEMRQFLQTREPGFRQQVDQATDQQIVDNLLNALTQRELLVAEARAKGIQPNTQRQDSMVAMVRKGFLDAARQLGLVSIQPQEGESKEQAIDRAVTALLQSILKGQRDVIPLGGVAFTLRQQYPTEVFAPAVDKVVQEVETVRGPGAAMPPGMPPGMPPMDMPMPDSTGAAAPALPTTGR